MLEVETAHGTKIDIPDVTGTDLSILRKALDDTTVFNILRLRTRLLEMCVKYEMHGIAVALLLATEFPNDDSWSPNSVVAAQTKAYLVWASRLGSFDAAIRLFHSFESYQYPNVFDGIPGTEYCTFTGAEEFRPGWVFLMERARHHTLKELKDSELEICYWGHFAAAFGRLAESARLRQVSDAESQQSGPDM
jgi:hypothetical protein